MLYANGKRSLQQIIDGKWCAIGSANFDDRSFETNDELTLAILDQATAGELDRIFEKYAANSSEIELERLSKRSCAHKFVDNAYYLINEIL